MRVCKYLKNINIEWKKTPKNENKKQRKKKHLIIYTINMLNLFETEGV